MAIVFNILLFILAVCFSIGRAQQTNIIKLLQCDSLENGICRRGTNCDPGEFPVYPFTCAIYSYYFRTEYTRCVKSMPCCYWVGATCQASCNSGDVEMNSQTSVCGNPGDKCCLSSTPASTTTASTVTPLKACRQRCYDRYQQQLQQYCPVPNFCWYSNYLVAQGNACYEVCRVTIAAAATPVPPIYPPTAVTTPLKACRVYCYEEYLRRLQQYCPAATYYCYYANAIASAGNSCYGDCNLIYKRTMSEGSEQNLPPVPEPVKSRSCGRSRSIPLPHFEHSNRIVGGEATKECQFPWTVFIRVGTIFCGGSILDSDTIVTAAHCVLSSAGGPVEPTRITVHYGSSNQSLTRTVEVTRVKVHPRFRLPVFDYDVALLTLASPLQYDECTQPICLPEAGAVPNAVCQVAGWGATNDTLRRTQQVLRQVALPVVSQRDCLSAYRDTRVINDLKICAGEILKGGVDACMGDSGGPLMCVQNGVFYLHGLVSFGQECGQPGFPGVYSRTAHPDIISWITANM